MLRLRPFELEQPASLEEAVTTLSSNPAAMPIAGGTDLLPKLKRWQFDPKVLVDLQGIQGLDEVKLTDGVLEVGALVKLRQLERHRALQDWPMLRRTLSGIATPTLRNAATVGGNLCQDTRCRYYDRSEGWREAIGYCAKKGADVCRVARGSSRCYATFCSDLAPALAVLGAEVLVVGRSRRWLPLPDLYVDEGIFNRGLDHELVAAVRLSDRPGYAQYRKLRLRGGFDFPEVGVAVSIEGRTPARVRVAMTAVSSNLPWWDVSCDADSWEDVAEAILSEVKPMDTLWFPPDYRKAIARTYLRGCFAEGFGSVSTPD